MEQNIIQVGNSVGVVIPSALKKQSGLKVGSKVIVQKTKDGILISPSKKNLAKGVNTKFAKMVDEFIEEHEDVLKELAKR